MAFFRVSRNPWGQETLVGVSWDLLWWFVGAGVVFILIHALWMMVRRPRHAARPDSRDGAA